MSRQHASPILLSDNGPVTLTPLPLGAGPGQISEADLQQLLHAHPQMLPIAEIDPLFSDPVPICTELNTPAGPIDALMVTRSGLPVLIECKLWRNAEARREVVGQILDYAKELSRWTAADLQREVSRRTGRTGNVVFDLVSAGAPAMDEVAFNDALTLNLRRGRCLLLIIGDGIREGVEAISEYLQAQAGLHFTLGLVELPIFLLPNGTRLVAPRIMARTTLVRREVIAVPDGFSVADADEPRAAAVDADRSALATEQQQFWDIFLKPLRLDDPDQAIPRPARQGYVVFMQPAPQGSCWINAYRDMKNNEVGVSLSCTVGVGLDAVRQVAHDWPAIKEELGGTVTMTQRNDRPFINDFMRVGDLTSSADRDRAFVWLRGRTNDFVNILRPRIKAAVADLAQG